MSLFLTYHFVPGQQLDRSHLNQDLGKVWLYLLQGWKVCARDRPSRHHLHLHRPRLPLKRQPRMAFNKTLDFSLSKVIGAQLVFQLVYPQFHSVWHNTALHFFTLEYISLNWLITIRWFVFTELHYHVKHWWRTDCITPWHYLPGIIYGGGSLAPFVLIVYNQNCRGKRHICQIKLHSHCQWIILMCDVPEKQGGEEPP